MDAKQIIFDSLKENKTGKMDIGILKKKCVKKNYLMEHEFKYEIIHMLGTGELGLTQNRKIYILDNERDIL